MIIFADTNKELCDQVNELKLTNILVINDDVLKINKLLPMTRIVTASNPSFSAGGGLDFTLKKVFSHEWVAAKEGVLTQNLFFVVSVGDDFKATEELVRKALISVKEESVYHTLILTGLGTGIGGLSCESFVGLFGEIMGCEE